jgi:hypothetical protein
MADKKKVKPIESADIIEEDYFASYDPFKVPPDIEICRTHSKATRIGYISANGKPCKCCG